MNNNIDIFEKCKRINLLFKEGKDEDARIEIIKLLDTIKNINNIPKNHLQYLNHLIRMSGIYIYIDTDNAILEDAVINKLFEIDIGSGYSTIHREQSRILKMLLNEKSILLSAPTSFGKSYIIDALIAIKGYRNIMIIVPTIALIDETRRRIYKKFSDKYKIITFSDSNISTRNIFILTQERAISYIGKIQNLDLFVVDEFYKIEDNKYISDYSDNYVNLSRNFILQKTVYDFGKISKQKYFLCPNVDNITQCVFIDSMEFTNSLKFKTVINDEEKIKPVTDRTIINRAENIYKNLPTHFKMEDKYPDSLKKKIAKLIGRYKNIIDKKNIIFVNSHKNTKIVCHILMQYNKVERLDLVKQLSDWIKKYYGEEFYLFSFLNIGIGIHNGLIHRFLSQIQLKLFDENKSGLNTIVATPSIIEGVNTSCENILLWNTKIGGKKIDYFTYKNIVGRSGRMGRYYKGNAYIIGQNVRKTSTNIDNIQINDLFFLDTDNNSLAQYLTSDKKEEIEKTRDEIIDKIGYNDFQKLKNDNLLKSTRKDVLSMIEILKSSTGILEKLKLLENDQWRNDYQILSDVLRLFRKKSISDKIYYNYTSNDIDLIIDETSKCIICLSYNWEKSIIEILQTLKNIVKIAQQDIIDLYFRLEQFISYNLYNLISDLNELQKTIFKDNDGNSIVDLSKIVTNFQSIFLPYVVAQLEEYGLPRMVSKKIHNSGLINFEDKNIDIYKCISLFHDIDKIKNDVTDFDIYILNYFYEGITSINRKHC